MEPGGKDSVQLIKEGDLLAVRVLSLDMLARFPIHVTCRSRMPANSPASAATAGLAFGAWQAARPPQLRSAPAAPAAPEYSTRGPTSAVPAKPPVGLDAAGRDAQAAGTAVCGPDKARQGATGAEAAAGRAGASCRAVTGEEA